MFVVLDNGTYVRGDIIDEISVEAGSGGYWLIYVHLLGRDYHWKTAKTKEEASILAKKLAMKLF